MIIRVINYAFIGVFVGASTPVLVWVGLYLLRHGLTRTVEMIRETSAAVVASGTADLLLKSGALVGGVLSVILAPYLAPFVARYTWPVLARLGVPPLIDARYLGAGFVGYFMRVKPSV